MDRPTRANPMTVRSCTGVFEGLNEVVAVSRLSGQDSFGKHREIWGGVVHPLFPPQLPLLIPCHL